MTEFQEVMDYIDKHVDSFVEELRRFCRIPSISAQNRGIDECAEALRGLMETLGIKSKLIGTRGCPVVFGELAAGRKDVETLVLYNHYDVQPPEPLNEWISDPFEAEIRDGKIFSRGVGDDKGVLMDRLMGVKVLTEVLDCVPVNLKFVVEGEEEIGSAHLPEFVEKHRAMLRGDSCLWEGGKRDPSGRPEVYLGVKGILYVELFSKTASTDQHSMWAPILKNPAWMITWALKSLKDENERILIDGWYDEIVEPSQYDLGLLEKIPFDEEEHKDILGVKGYLKDMKGMELLKALYFNPTCTICGLNSGYTGEGTKTVTPREAFAKIDFRLVPKQKPAEMFRKLKQHLAKLGLELDVRMHTSFEPARTDPSSKIVRVMVDTAKTVYRVEPVVIPTMPGSGPMSLFIGRLGLPVAGGEAVARSDSRFHAPNENIRTDDYIQGIKHFTAITMAL